MIAVSDVFRRCCVIALVLATSGALLGTLWFRVHARTSDVAVEYVPRVDFGDVRSDQVQRATLNWMNSSSSELHFQHAATDCNCLTVVTSEMVVAPYGNLTLEIELHPPGEAGPLEVPFSVFLHPNRVLRGTVSARVLARPEVTRNSVVAIMPGAAEWSAVVTIRLPWAPGAAEVHPEPLNPAVGVTLALPQWAGTDSEISATIRGPVHPNWSAPLANASDDWREAVVFEVRHPDATVRLRTQITLVREDSLSVSPRKLLLGTSERGYLTLQDDPRSGNEEIIALTDPPDCAVLELLGQHQFAVTAPPGAPSTFDVLLVGASRSIRVPVVIVPEGH